MTTEQQIEKILKEKNILNKERSFSWVEHSALVAEHCPQYINSQKYNWYDCSWVIAGNCPQHIDPIKYNWEKDSWAIVKYCPEKLDLDQASLTSITQWLREYKNLSLKEIKEQAIKDFNNK